MITVDANGAALNESLVRFTIKEIGKERNQFAFYPEKVFMHPIQVLSVVAMSLAVAEIVKGEAPAEIPESPVTMAGIPVIQIPELPEDEIDFRDLDGEVCGKIIHLAKAPVG